MTKKLKTIRMNGSSYELATGALCRHALNDGVLRLLKAENDLANELIGEFVGVNAKAWKAVPKDWLPMRAAVGVNALGWKVRLAFANLDEVVKHQAGQGVDIAHLLISLSDGVKRRVALPDPIACDQWNQVKSEPYSTGPEIGARIQAHVLEKKAFIEKAQGIVHTIRQTVRAFKTANDLLEAIPELETLAPTLLVVTPTMALVPSVERMMCQIAAARGDARDGCTAGKRDADVEPALAA